MSEKKIPMVSTYLGQDIRTMTREELIDALECVGRQLAECYTPSSIRARALGSVEMMKRGER